MTENEKYIREYWVTHEYCPASHVEELFGIIDELREKIKFRNNTQVTGYCVLCEETQRDALIKSMENQIWLLTEKLVVAENYIQDCCICDKTGRCHACRAISKIRGEK